MVQQRHRVLFFLMLFLVILNVLVLADEPKILPAQGLAPPPSNFKVAFIGDQGLGLNSQAVLSLIQDEGANIVLHQGDFDYVDDPEAWDQQINDILGPTFPYFASVGNHDVKEWAGYQQKLQERLTKVPEAVCGGDLGVKSACYYQGLFFILSGVGTMGIGHNTYLQEQLAANDSIWRICSWHKNQTAMQVGAKINAVGWDAYEACREAGAIIATGHEHSYSRSKTLRDMQAQTVDPTCPDDPSTPDTDVCVRKGATFAFVSGIAGQSIRRQRRCLPTTYPYGCNGEWAKIYAAEQEALPGALFITFNLDGNLWQAQGYFKNIEGEVIDSFMITAPEALPTQLFLPLIHH